jgi:retron-type reverse transcriptase
MKRYGNLWEEVTSFENLCRAFYKARRGKPKSPEAAAFFYDLEGGIIKLQKELWAGTYKTGPYRVFRVYEPKERIIKAVPFRDRVVHHALCNVIEPLFDAGFIYDSFACRKNKGTHKGLERLRSTVRGVFKQGGYALKCDIKKYFPSIDHETLKALIRKKIKDSRVLRLIDEIIDSSHSEYGAGKGIPIGNLTSQLFANIYLNELDQYVKHRLRARHYIRYVDDFIVLSHSKKELHICKQRIKCFLKTLFLVMHKTKANVFLIKDGVDFLGYKVFPCYTRIRKSNIKKFVKRARKQLALLSSGRIREKRIESSLLSWMGHLCHADAYFIGRKVVQGILPGFVWFYDRETLFCLTKKLKSVP